MQNVKLRDAPSERSMATRSCTRGTHPSRSCLAGGRQHGTSGGARLVVWPCVQKEAVGLISRQMVEGVGGEAGPGVLVKITPSPVNIHTYTILRH